MSLSFADRTWRRWLAATVVISLGSLLSSNTWAANSNPTVTFTTNTNQTNLAGRPFQIQLFTVTNYTNQAGLFVTSQISSVTSPPVTRTNVDGTVVTNITITYSSTNLYSNDTVSISASLLGLGGTNLTTNGLIFYPATGLLLGNPRTNFVLEFSNNLSVTTTNQRFSTTNVQANRSVTTFSNNRIFTNFFPGTSTITISATNTTATTNTNTNAFRLVFQLPALVTNFPFTNMPANATTNLPATNGLGLQYGYQLISGQGILSSSNGTNYLTSTGMQPVVLRVSLAPTSPALQIWLSNSANLTISKTEPSVLAFGFATNTNLALFTRTNLAFGAVTPLLATNQWLYRPVFTAFPAASNQIFFSNHPTIPNVQIPYFRALAGTGSVAVTARIPGAQSVLTINRTQAPAPTITMLGVFSNTNANPLGGTFTNTNPSLTTLPLLAYSSSSNVVAFVSSDTNIVRITNGNTLIMVGNGTSSIVASNFFLNTNNYSNAVPVTNTLVVDWGSNPPVFTSTNRQDGVQGVLFTYFLVAGPNTNAFPISYGASNLAPGLFFVTPNRIMGTPPQPGLFRMQLMASNVAGTTNGQLLSYFTNFPPLRVTNAWSFVLSLGVGSDTNGTYLFSTNGTNGPFAPNNLPAGIGSVTNSNSATPPVLVLTNTNTNPLTGFVGETNLWVQFTNNSTGLFYLTNFSLRVLPSAPPVLSYTSATNVLSAGAFAAITNQGYIPGLGSPANFRASNLPPGLLVQTNGTILGAPRVAGVYSSAVSASNSFGAASSNLVFQVSPVAGYPWSFSLADLFPGAGTNATYRAGNLPPGMSLNTNSGLVTGTARGVGSYDITVVQSSNGTPQQTNSTNVVIGPPAPLLRLPSVALQGRVGQPFAYQPWVSGAGWEWSGADEFSAAWTNRIIVTNGAGVTNTNRISANNNGTLLATTNGMTLTNNASNNTLALLWSAELPSSWPWQATLRMKVPGNLTRGLAGPFLGVFRAQTPLGTNFYDRYAEAFLDASVAGKIPGASFMNTNAGGTTSLATVGTNEIAVRITYETNGSQLVMALNTNPNGVWTNFTSVLTNSNLGSSWNLTNAGSAFRLWAGFSASNQPTSSGQALYRKFALLPGGVAFSASNLPAWASIDPVMGTIYGTPTLVGTNAVVITVSNTSGTSQGAYRLIVLP